MSAPRRTDPIRQARAEINEYFENLVPAELVGQKLRALAQELEAEQFQAEQLQVQEQIASEAPELQTVNTYLARALERQDIDPRLRLDILTTLCWSKREEAAASLPAPLYQELAEELSADWLTPQELLELWELWAARATPAHAPALARLLLWWALAQLVSNAVHLQEGEVADTLRPLQQAFRTVRADREGWN